MSLFEFLMVFVSIIVGLGVTEILTGLAQRIRHRADVSGYWVHYCGVALILFALIQNWWELWERRYAADWTFFTLVLMLIAPASMYLIAHLIFPQPMRGSDIRAHYFSQTRPIWSLAVLAVVSSVMLGPLAFGSELLTADNAASGVLFAGFLALAISRNPILHAVLVPAFLALIVWDVIRFHPAFSIG
ncbi:MAG: hypothetical protein QNI99_15715 [Woeseiaceae bacterium]|nr:hypothetical protein [Woeseiaceae bacterium]